MDETLPAAVDARHVAASPSFPGEALRPTIAAVGARAVAACGGIACIIGWRGGDRDVVVRTPADARWRAPLAAVLALAERQPEPLPNMIAAVSLEPGQLAPLLTERLTRGATAQAIAARHTSGDHAIITVLLTPVGRQRDELVALAQLSNEAVGAIVEGDEVRGSRDFWMSAGSTSGAQLAAVRAELTAALAERAGLEAALTRCAKLRPRQRFAGLGAIFAGLGPFDEWMVASSGDSGLRVEAVSRVSATLPEVGATGALAECIARKVVIVRTIDASSVAAPEPLVTVDRLFAGFARYLCVPCGRAAIALATRRKIEPAVVGALERWAVRLSPVVEKWLTEGEVERLQRLVRSLGLRMFGAVDRERQRIARNLHDHQTQLLTAARIALEAYPARTRGILRELDESLRRQLREIRPATLGRSTLREALDDEIDRLAGAGIRGNLLYPERAMNFSRPIQELCYQVAREAVSNVIRHAGASRVELSVERLSGQVLLRVADDGKGWPSRHDQTAVGKQRSGVGLAGMAERLELMGGRLRIERRGKITRLTAEIPEL
jgi:signal transduction histidine kinase